MRRRTKNNAVAAKLIAYLMESRRLTQIEIANILEVDKSFVSRVKAGQRDLSTYQLRQLADSQGLPMGAMMLAALESSKSADPERRKIQELATELVQLTDKAMAAAKAEIEARNKEKRSA